MTQSSLTHPDSSCLVGRNVKKLQHLVNIIGRLYNYAHNHSLQEECAQLIKLRIGCTTTATTTTATEDFCQLTMKNSYTATHHQNWVTKDRGVGGGCRV